MLEVFQRFRNFRIATVERFEAGYKPLRLRFELVELIRSLVQIALCLRVLFTLVRVGYFLFEL